ncbi:hypothetical protein [Clostridium beijerinckii]|uniref:hypothetical protein n=1 Tax=Clostridium beijerinckii TaxID=1520 RepID=UPI000685765B|nr:hypothetical protein [Clostridium beijerinckii]
MIVLSLMSILGCFIFKMTKNNNDLGCLYNFDKDRYDLSSSEEQVLNKFMIEMNKERLNDEEWKEDIFSESFNKKIDDNIIEYNKDNNKMLLTTYKEDDVIRKRSIIYSFKGGKIILIPTYNFDDYNK